MRIKEAEKRPPQHMFLQKIWELKLRGNMHRECPWRDHSLGMILDAIPTVILQTANASFKGTGGAFS